jgi:prepilin-type N-terminal cleavage/methylation domain-containing protein
MKKGFTLIELLIVVAIIGILTGVGVLTYNSYMEQAKYNAILTNFDIVSENTDLFI